MATTGQEVYNTGDDFTNQVLEGSRRKRQTGYGNKTVEELNVPRLRVRMEGKRESTNTIDERPDPSQPPRFDLPTDRAFVDEIIQPKNPATQWKESIQESSGLLEDILETLSVLSRPELYYERPNSNTEPTVEEPSDTQEQK